MRQRAVISPNAWAAPSLRLHVGVRFGPRHVICGRGRCVAAPLHRSRCLSLVWCDTADLVTEYPVLHNPPGALPCYFCLFPPPRSCCSPPVVSPTRPGLFIYLFHRNKINNRRTLLTVINFSSDSITKQSAALISTWTYTHPASLIFFPLLHWRTFCSPSDAAASTSVDALMCKCSWVRHSCSSSLDTRILPFVNWWHFYRPCSSCGGQRRGFFAFLQSRFILAGPHSFKVWGLRHSFRLRLGLGLGGLQGVVKVRVDSWVMDYVYLLHHFQNRLVLTERRVCFSHGRTDTRQAASSAALFSPPAILFVRPPVNVAAGLASFLALLLLISARHRDRQKERAFSGRS